MIKALVSPSKYIQGTGTLDQSGKFIAPLGKSALVVWDQFVHNLVSERLETSFHDHDVKFASFIFSGECSRNQVNLGIERAEKEEVDVIVGVGGGKAIDLAKAIAFNVNARMISIPTVASNDAPTSAATVYYTDEGVLDGWDVWPRNPDLVLVDSRIIAQAPIRWFVSGIGDALATWFEAEAAYKGRRAAFSGGVPTMTAMSLARLCYETLLTYGLDAKMDA